ncbi:MAG: hypothetical protein LBG92_02755 [Prevotellaceae bacterium]|nr:hypothetical protein [Prevotellaceae bacterium]
MANDELHLYKTNFWTNVHNCHIKLENVTAKDSSGNIIALNNLMSDREQLLVCRFSELNCESCVNASIRSVQRWVDSVGKENILFFGTYRSNKIFNKTKPQYNIQELNVYNISPLNIPAEELGYPYYFVLNSDLTVSNLFVPDKSIPAITDSYLKAIHERYFATKK